MPFKLKELSRAAIALLQGKSPLQEDFPWDFRWRGQTSIVPDRHTGSGTPTFTRATTAYQQDFEGKLNLVPSGEARFQGARWVRNMILSSSENVVFPAGSWGDYGAPTAATATSITFAANNSNGRKNTSITPAATPAQTFVTRVLVWTDSGTKGFRLQISKPGIADYVSSDLTATTTPTIFTTTHSTAAGATSTDFYIRNSSDAAAGKINITNIQVQDKTGVTVAAPDEYVSVGVLSAPYHGANVDGVKYFDTLNGNTVASNVVTEATGAKIVTGAAGVAATAPVDASGPFGYLAEGARADVLGTTAAIRRTMADVGWVVGATTTVGSATGADGVASAAASLTGGAVTATNTILFTTVLGSAARTYSAWIRRKTGTGTIEMTDNGGTNWTDITSTLTTTYKLFQVTRTQANPVVGFRITTNLDAIEVDFNTIEAAAFANPTPIPVNVSKAADVLTYPSAGNVIAASGTWYAEVLTAPLSIDNKAIFNTGNSGQFYIQGVTNNLAAYNGANNPTGGSFTAGVLQKVGMKYGGNLASAYLGGSVVFSDQTYTSGMTVGANIVIGSNSGVETFGTIRNVRIYARALPTTQLQVMTT